MAAHRAHLKTLIIPARNEKDLVELPKMVTRDLNIEMVDRLDQVFELAFDEWTVPTPEPERTGERHPEPPLSPPAPH